MHSSLPRKERWLLSDMKKGFTLIELLVGIAVLVTLLAGVFVAINPARQIAKAQDSVRQQNIEEIKKALDLYYHDTGCYPQTDSNFVNSLENGEEWSEGSNVYMKEVPRDPATQDFYTYLADTIESPTCPQWFTIMAKLSTERDESESKMSLCSLPRNSSCAPVGYDENWTCATSGNIADTAACSQISQTLIISPTMAPTQAPVGSGNEPTGTASGELSPTPAAFAVPMNTDPYFYTGTVQPFDSTSGGMQIINIIARTGSEMATVSRVEAEIKVGATILGTYQFTLVSGDNKDGNWRGSWDMPAHTNGVVMVTLTVVRSDNVSASTELSLP